MDAVARGEMVEAELTRIIEKRARKGEEDPDEQDPGYIERARQERRAQWVEYHECMCRLHTQLAGEHQQKAERLCQAGDEP